MRWAIPVRSGVKLHFAFLPVPLVGGGWAWLEWVEMQTVSPKAFGVVGDIRTFTALQKEASPPSVVAASPNTPPPPKPKR